MVKILSTKTTRRALVMLAVVAMSWTLLASSTRPAHAATFTVTNTNDSGAGSLRSAIADANATAGADTINFNIPGAGPHTIAPRLELPTIFDPVTINGYSQPGANPNTLTVGNNAVLKIELNGILAGPGARGLRLGAANSTIRGLVINNFTGNGVLIEGSGATGNKVEGNFVGTDTTGTADRGTYDNGVLVNNFASDNTVGGTTAAARNVISGNAFHGVYLNASTGNKVMGNYIGTDKNGTADLGNTFDGVVVGDSSNNTVGGTTAEARNVISGNDRYGVFIFSSPGSAQAEGNVVQGNYIGSDKDGAADLGNTLDGLHIQDSSDTTIGGTTAEARNVISGNDDGVSIFSSSFGTTGNRILSNSIFSNGRLGIDLRGGTETTDGVTANDAGDADAGPNNLQNYPEITSARPTVLRKRIRGRIRRIPTTTIAGTLNSTPGQTFTVQLFSSPTADPSGFGEGKTFLGQTSVTTDPTTGSASFGLRVRRSAAPVGSAITATATDSNGNTSEFSGARTVQ